MAIPIPETIRDLTALPVGFQRPLAGEEGHILVANDDIALDSRVWPFDFKFSDAEQEVPARVIKQFHTNYRPIYYKATNYRGERENAVVREPSELFGFVVPEGSLRLAALHRLANIMTDDMVLLKGVIPPALEYYDPLVYDSQSTYSGAHRLFLEHIKVPEEDAARLIQCYGKVEGYQEARFEFMRQVQGNSRTDLDDMIRILEGRSTRELDIYERYMRDKYEEPMEKALHRMNKNGFGISHSGVNFGYDTERDRIIFFELSALPNYDMTIREIKELPDAETRERACSLLNTAIDYEQAGLKRITEWWNQRKVGRFSDFNFVPLAGGMMPFPKGMSDKCMAAGETKFLMDWSKGLDQLRTEHPDIMNPRKPELEILELHPDTNPRPFLPNPNFINVFLQEKRRAQRNC